MKLNSRCSILFHLLVPVWSGNWIRLKSGGYRHRRAIMDFSRYREPLDPFRFVLVAVAGWMNQRQVQIIDYLREGDRVIREQLGERRLRLNDDQRRRLAAN